MREKMRSQIVVRCTVEDKAKWQAKCLEIRSATQHYYHALTTSTAARALLDALASGQLGLIYGDRCTWVVVTQAQDPPRALRQKQLAPGPHAARPRRKARTRARGRAAGRRPKLPGRRRATRQ